MRPWAVPIVAAAWLAALAAGAQAADRAPDSASLHPLTRLAEPETYVAGQGLVAWRDSAAPLRASETAVDSLRVSVGGVLRAPGGPLLDPKTAQFDRRTYEISLIRNWPSALRMGAGGLDLDLTPHAGLGMTSYGGLAEAGATLRMSPSREDDALRRLRDLGVGDGTAFGDKGRWYLFMAASGRAVGLNMLRHNGGWDRAGWSTDASSTLISDAQLGFGWRKGAVQSSLGFVHREVKGDHMLFGQTTKHDSLLAFTLSVKPGQ